VEVKKKYAIRQGVKGPGGAAGFLLIAPPSEALDWDVQNEIGSNCRCWSPDYQAWWIAAPYLTTARQILQRVEPRPEPIGLRLARLPLPPRISMRLASLFNLGSLVRSSVDRV
jgi:hypothetical protein